MSLSPPRLDDRKRCFAYCGDDRCNCGAAEELALLMSTETLVEGDSGLIGDGGTSS